jgi:hypothetical protein
MPSIDERWVSNLFGLLVRGAVVVNMSAVSDKLREESLPCINAIQEEAVLLSD